MATIEENGDYHIKAPLGEVEISVTNRMLEPRGAAAVGAPRLGKAQAGDQPVKGRYVQLPSQYEDPHASGLKYTVTQGPQTHDVELSANPG